MVDFYVVLIHNSPNITAHDIICPSVDTHIDGSQGCLRHTVVLDSDSPKIPALTNTFSPNAMNRLVLRARPATLSSSRLSTRNLFPSPFKPPLGNELPRCRYTSTSASSGSLVRSKVNGPPSTLPPPLAIAAQKPDQSYFPSYLFSIGKAYLSFYKTGVKAIYQNYKAARPVQAALNAKYHGSLSAAINDGSLTRTEFQLLVRNFHDLKRVPVFALVFFVCGEFTPLIVVAISSVVPYTCRIPKQIDSDRTTLERRRAASFRNLTEEFVDDGRRLEKRQLLHISRSLGLSGAWWDWMGGPPTVLLKRRVKRRVDYLHMDDTLISRCGGVENMSMNEIILALEERGVDVIGRNESQLKTSLKIWLNARNQIPLEKLLLTR